MLNIVIVTYNSEDVIATCISSIPSNVHPHIIIVDNASTDSTTSIVEKKFKGILVHRLQENLGYAGGNNIGIELALKKEAEQILILNPDTILHNDCIKKLLLHVETHVQTQILGPKIYKESARLRSGKKILWSVGGELDAKRFTAKLIGYKEEDNGQHDNTRVVDFLSGTCMLIPRKILESGLRFEEKYFLYYEDVDFCLRAKKKGYTSIVVPEAKIDHLELSNQTSPNEVHNTFLSSLILSGRKKWKNYYLARNHLLFVERNAPFRVQLREFVRLPKSTLEHLVTKDVFANRGMKDYFLRRFGQMKNDLRNKV